MGADRNDHSGLDRIEGYLLWNAELAQARREAAGFTAHLPWLTTAQREEVERVYVADRVRLSRETLRRVIDRAAELRGEYGERYEYLRRRCVAAAVVGAGATAGALGAAAYLTR
ncbi:hypothetical protein OG896_38710 [Streptomyces sp. NBC_00669]|uniref:hypothetical protein n=1 Tax=Streptomyces sp. NBC_00669 TaxID=2976011 RepID=UPI002E332209|nr:hypothetical protein [Streptomyces sp. NBC_00669]